MATHTLSGSDAVMKALEDIAKKMGGGTVSVGFMENAKYSDGTPVAGVAFWNEFGHDGPFPSPPRPFFRTMIAKESPGWPAKMAALAKATDLNGSKVLALMGEDISGALVESIDNVTAPELSKTTLRLREVFGNSPEKIKFSDVLQAQRDVAAGAKIATGTHAKPLTWTGHMKNSITYKVDR